MQEALENSLHREIRCVKTLSSIILHDKRYSWRKLLRMLALCKEQGYKADARRLRRKPVSFDSEIPVEHFKKNLILADSGETFCSRFAVKTDLIAAVLLCLIETTIGYRLQGFKLILPLLFTGTDPQRRTDPQRHIVMQKDLPALDTQA